MTNSQALNWQINSVPKDKNYIYFECSSCGLQTAVPKKDHVVDFCCSNCYSTYRNRDSEASG